MARSSSLFRHPWPIAADHVMNAWWVCPNGHEYQATVRARTQGNRRCPTCYGGWSLENIRAFVKSLVGHLDKLNPSELFALAMQAGVNFTDYIREAHRCLHIDGHLHIWEAASYFDDVKKFAAALAKLGFDVTTPSIEGAFVRYYAIKNAKKPDAKLVLPFRGAANGE